MGVVELQVKMMTVCDYLGMGCRYEDKDTISVVADIDEIGLLNGQAHVIEKDSMDLDPGLPKLLHDAIGLELCYNLFGQRGVVKQLKETIDRVNAKAALQKDGANWVKFSLARNDQQLVVTVLIAGEEPIEHQKIQEDMLTLLDIIKKHWPLKRTWKDALRRRVPQP